MAMYIIIICITFLFWQFGSWRVGTGSPGHYGAIAAKILGVIYIRLEVTPFNCAAARQHTHHKFQTQVSSFTPALMDQSVKMRELLQSILPMLLLYSIKLSCSLEANQPTGMY